MLIRIDRILRFKLKIAKKNSEFLQSKLLGSSGRSVLLRLDPPLKTKIGFFFGFTMLKKLK
ncbi:hypothetical protein LEP1GSC109_0905 [Leptospira interrogans str. UI 13372]|nr:hypothetical protein LEP1GSC109_0905 [Leptospira interrogans str. UI 13372]MCR8639301.1 hypothetical protein [Leptospira interrogans serovar Ricardi]OAM72821.1 hypothetical protein A1343_01445 [Leptospira interrogans serovar Bataviae]